MLNKAQLIGRLGRDPEQKYLANGDAVCNFSIATSESWKDKNSGEKQEKTEWHNIVAFRKLAEVCAQYLVKGALVYVEGKITTRKWQDKEGKDRYTTEIVANEMKMLGGKQQADSDPAPKRETAEKPRPSLPGNIQDMGDDVPFNALHKGIASYAI